jgi:hypothetical protein
VLRPVAGHRQDGCQGLFMVGTSPWWKVQNGRAVWSDR